jgi:serine protease Do
MPRLPLAGRGFATSLISLLLVASTAAAAAGEDASDAPAPEVSRSTILAANAYPGVQLISTTYTATVNVAIPQINQAAVEALATRVANQAISGAIDTTEEAITEAIVDGIVSSPNTYFVAGPRVYSRRNKLVGVGTGWVITPDGYMITAAHVVDTPDAQLRQEFAVNSLSKLGQQFIRGVQNSGTAFTRDQTDRLTDAILGWLAGHMSVTQLKVSVSANIALGFDGIGKQQKPVAAEIIDVGKPYPGNDVALLKIDGQENLPTISVGNNDDVSPGSTVHVVGFPAASTFSPGLSQDAQVQPTVTEGPITAIKSTGGGMPVFQTQAPSSPGNSGGPVLTDDGTSVGVLVATAVNSDGTAAQGQAFVIPASEITDMLEQNGVTAEESETTAAYSNAVDSFYAERYKEALPLFEKAETLYPAHPFAQKFIRDSKTAIEDGRDKTPAAKSGGSGKTLVWLGLAGVAALLLGGGVFALLRARKRKQPSPGPDWGQSQAPGQGFQPGGFPATAHPQQAQGQPGYGQPSQQGGYPQAPQQGGYPPQAGYPQGGYPQEGYPPAAPQGGYPPQAPPAAPQAGYPAQGHPPAAPQGGYPQQFEPQAGYPQGGYPPAPQGGYPQAGSPAVPPPPPPMPPMPPTASGDLPAGAGYDDAQQPWTPQPLDAEQQPVSPPEAVEQTWAVPDSEPEPDGNPPAPESGQA